ncbi:MAG: hypothetical protein M3442_01245 [Chloroflexota bacterium]|nr:hypothetical protein [Chloroflexota bacterium]
MATTTQVSERIDPRLRELASEASFLPELAAGWAEEWPANRDVWYLEWRELMGRLKGLDQAYQEGAMTESQLETYRALRHVLQEQLPVLKQLGLPLLSVPVTD